MTKSRKVGIVFALTLAFVLVCAGIVPLFVNGNDVAHAVTVSSRDEWVNSYKGTYYDNLNTDKTGAAFRTDLANLITTTHKKETTYDQLKTVFKTSDADPNQSGNVIWFYTGSSVPYTGAMDSGNYPTNREHVWPKMNGNAFPASSKAGSDAHHLRPLNTKLNNTRNNYQFGEVAQTTGNRVLQSGTYSDYGTTDPDTWCYLSGGAFYPAKGYRGATARILFYVQTRWGNDYSLKFVLGQGNTKTMGDIATLLKWHLEEPPTDEEIRRNEVVFDIQGNRNPFIDHPEYAEMIYCNDGQSYNNALKNTVEQYGSYLNDNPTPPTPPILTGLTISQATLSMTEGDVSQALTVNAIPSGASNSVNWSTSNSSIATVNNGVVTAVGAGVATITATSTVNPAITVSCTVTVTAKQIVLQSLTISPSTLSLTAGDVSQTLTVTATPSGASNSVNWSTSNSSVATVNNGVVTAVGAGVATITATSTVNPAITVSCTVTVTAKQTSKVDVTSVTVSDETLTLTVGSNKQLTASVSPSNATVQGLVWSSSDNSVVTVSSTGLVTAVGAGSATVTVTSVDNPNASATVTVTVVEVAVDDSEFLASLAAIDSAKTLEQRYTALRKAIDEYNKLSAEGKANNASNFSLLQQKVADYNSEVRGFNNELSSATGTISQTVAAVAAISLAILAVFAIGKAYRR